MTPRNFTMAMLATTALVLSLSAFWIAWEEATDRSSEQRNLAGR